MRMASVKLPAEASRLPSDENATAVIRSTCPRSFQRSFSGERSQTRMHGPSPLPLASAQASRRSSGENAKASALRKVEKRCSSLPLVASQTRNDRPAPASFLPSEEKTRHEYASFPGGVKSLV